MNILRKAFLFAAIAIATAVSAQSTKRMAFDSNHEFKIAQFTDIHWCDDSIAKCEKTLASMQAVIDTEKPDLIIITGDVITDHPAVKGWKSIINFFHKQGIPYAVTMGNHDAEFLSKDSIYTMLTDDPVYVGVRGNQVSGYGNMTISLYASDGSDKVNGVIYLIDSNDYPKDNLFGKYDWIHFDQIEWYRRESAAHKAANGGVPVPSLAFMHIPVPEYAEAACDQNTLLIGTRKEASCNPKINTGLFSAMLLGRDVMGMFVGHDHVNDYICDWKGMALAYGRYSGGHTVYHDIQGDNGARVIELTEGVRGFDTWIRLRIGNKKINEVKYPTDFLRSGDE